MRSRDSGPVERSATIRHEFSQLRIVFRFAGRCSHSRWPVVKLICSSTLVCSRIVINNQTGSEDKLCPAPWQALRHDAIHLGVPILRYLFVTLRLIDITLASAPRKYHITTPIERKTCGKQFCLGGVCTSKERREGESGELELDTGCAALGPGHVTLTSQHFVSS